MGIRSSDLFVIKSTRSLPRLRRLPGSLPLEGAVRIELEEGAPILRASSTVQKRVDALLIKEREQGLTSEEMEAFDEVRIRRSESGRPFSRTM
jgi:hypothetical protein